jgi:hypothetical protein
MNMLGTAVDGRLSREAPSTGRFRSVPSDGDVLVSKRTARADLYTNQDIACVATQDRVQGISPPAVIVADRWGEIVLAVENSEIADFPAPQELIEWLTYVSNQCPECEGEAR